MRDLTDLLGEAVDARTRVLDGLVPGDAAMSAMTSEVRRGRRLRHLREAAAALPVVLALGVGGWVGVASLTGTGTGTETGTDPGRVTEPGPAVTRPEPSAEPVPGPESSSSGGTEGAVDSPPEEAGVPTYQALSQGVLDRAGPGWVLATYAPRPDGGAPAAELVLLADPGGARYLVARLDTGATPAPDGTTWRQRELVAWSPSTATAVLRELSWSATDDGDRAEVTGTVALDLRTGQLAPDPTGGSEEPWAGLASPDGRLLLDGTLVLDATTGRQVADLPSDGPAGRCTAVTWWSPDRVLALCTDPEADVDPGVVTAADGPRLVMLGIRSPDEPGTVVRRLGAGDPYPSWHAVHVRDGQVAWVASEVGSSTPGCHSGVVLQTGDRLERLGTSDAGAPAERSYTVEVHDGTVYVLELAGCLGDAVPLAVRSYDPDTGVGTDLLPPPRDVTGAGAVVPGLTSYAVAR